MKIELTRLDLQEIKDRGVHYYCNTKSDQGYTEYDNVKALINSFVDFLNQKVYAKIELEVNFETSEYVESIDE